MDRWQLWVVEWVLVFTVPKLFIVPAVKWMLDALRATERQDEIDRAWLEEEAERRRGRDGGWGGGRRTRVPDDGRPNRPRRPHRPRRPGGGTARRTVERRARVARVVRGRPIGHRRGGH